MAIWTASSFVRHADTPVPGFGTGVSFGASAAIVRASAGQAGYAPGQGPGVATSVSSSTLVSKSLKPRRW